MTDGLAAQGAAVSPSTFFQLSAPTNTVSILVVQFRNLADGVKREHFVATRVNQQLDVHLYRDIEPKCLVITVPAGAAPEPHVVSLALAERHKAVQNVMEDAFILPANCELPSPKRFPNTTVKDRIRWRVRLRRLRRFPITHFDGLAYLQQNPDVAEAVLSGALRSAVDHFVASGRHEGRRLTLARYRAPNWGDVFDLIGHTFDGISYLEANPDVVDEIMNMNLTSALEQFVRNGRFEGRTANPVSPTAARRGTISDLVLSAVDHRFEALSKDLAELTSARQYLTGRVTELEAKLENRRLVESAEMRSISTGDDSARASTEELAEVHRADIDRLMARTLGMIERHRPTADRRTD